MRGERPAARLGLLQGQSLGAGFPVNDFLMQPADDCSSRQVEHARQGGVAALDAVIGGEDQDAIGQ